MFAAIALRRLVASSRVASNPDFTPGGHVLQHHTGQRHPLPALSGLPGPRRSRLPASCSRFLTHLRGFPSGDSPGLV